MSKCGAQCGSGTTGAGGAGGAGMTTGAGGSSGGATCADLQACCNLASFPMAAKSSCDMYAQAGNEANCATFYAGFKGAGLCP